MFIDYIERLAKDFSVYFDVERDVLFYGIHLDVRASFQRINERYFMTKKTTMYRYDLYEYFYVKVLEDSNLTKLKTLISDFEDVIVNNKTNHEDHMSSEHTLILLLPDKLSEEIKEFIQNYSFKKSFMMGLKGFLHFGIVLRDQDGNMIYSKNRRHKKYRFLEKKGR